MRKSWSFALGSLLVLGLSLGATWLLGPAVRSSPPSSSVKSLPYDPAQLQADAVMIEQMSVANAAGPMQNGRNGPDPQLQRAADPAYVRALEQHHIEIDRMLARPTP